MQDACSLKRKPLSSLTSRYLIWLALANAYS